MTFFRKYYFVALIFGMFLPFSFAPMSVPGIAIVSLAALFVLMTQSEIKQAIIIGFMFAFGFFGVGVSWVYVSIHDYGHLSMLFSAVLTLMFTLFLSLYFILIAYAYKYLSKSCGIVLSAFNFALVWVIVEWLRATLFTGFPWLLLGISQIDTPMKELAPILGTYGLSFFTALAGAFLGASVISRKKLQSYAFILAMVFIYLIPGALHETEWTNIDKKAVKVGVIQSNIAMRDKWNLTLYKKLLRHYLQSTESLMNMDVIIWPESALPIPYDYLGDVLKKLVITTKAHDNTVILGLPKVYDDDSYYNAMIALGNAKGVYYKQHLVPFGEYVPGKLLKRFFTTLQLPEPNLVAGNQDSTSVIIENTPVAAMICYEVAFSDILRKQLPIAQWIITISDDGWFGHSMAMAQHLQMARMRSLQTGRYQVVANNNGLSAIINNHGNIDAILPAYHSGNLKGIVFRATGATPWVMMGDNPLLLMLFMITFFLALKKAIKQKSNNKTIDVESMRRYPRQP
jgi:apolipoprotein N-acyltransferase